MNHLSWHRNHGDPPRSYLRQGVLHMAALLLLSIGVGICLYLPDIIVDLGSGR